jgi:hypothetical protein
MKILMIYTLNKEIILNNININLYLIIKYVVNKNIILFFLILLMKTIL